MSHLDNWIIGLFEKGRSGILRGIGRDEGLRYRGETRWELIFSTGEEGKGPQGQPSNQMPSKGRTRQGHVTYKVLRYKWGLIGVQRGNAVCFGEKHLGSERRPKFRRALVVLGTAETRRKRTGLGLYQTESDTEFVSWEAHPCSYLSDEDVAVLRAFQVRRLRQVVGCRTPIARNEESWSASLQVLYLGLNTCSDATTP
jgi:hypothetical protein